MGHEEPAPSSRDAATNRGVARRGRRTGRDLGTNAAADAPTAAATHAPAGDANTPSARELLAEFQRTGDERTFEEVVRRYAGMVFNVCLRVTKDAHDAEDATQAVFLALAVHSKTRPNQPIQYIGPWLQQVARRLALDMRRSKTRRKKREQKLGELERQRLGIGYTSAGPTNGNANGRMGAAAHGNFADALAGPADAFDQEELKQLIGEEIQKLPAKYRLPLILHYFGGLSRDEMAKELGVKPNTLGVRVFRGRELLGKQLAKRGILLSAAAVGVLMEQMVRSVVSDAFVASTAHAAAGAAAASVAGHGAVASAAGLGAFGAFAGTHSAMTAAQVTGLMRSVTRGMILAKVKVAAIALVLLGTVVAGGAEVAQTVARRAGWEWRAPLDFNVVEHLRDLLRSIARPIRLTEASDDGAAKAGAGTLASAAAGANDALARALPLNGGNSTARVVTETLETSMTASAAYAGWPPPLPPPLALSSQADKALDAAATPDLPPAALVAQAAPAPLRLESGGARRVNRAGSETGEAAVATPMLTPHAPVVMGAAAGSRETRTLGGNETLATPGDLVVGDRGEATFRQLGPGSLHDIGGDLVLGRDRGSRGRYELAGGRLRTGGDQVVGDSGIGEFIQTDGANIVGGSLVVGRSGSSHGTYAQADGKGEAAGGLVVAQEPGSAGTVMIEGGDFRATPQVIGQAGDGSLHQSGGTNTTSTIWVAPGRGSTGSYALGGGVLQLDALADLEDLSDLEDRDVFKDVFKNAGINVGGAGEGSFRMGDHNKKAKIVESQAGSYLAIRAKESGTGLFRGWGSVGITGRVVNNGQVIADGYGGRRALDLSQAAGVLNTIDNSTVGGTNGWFASDGGELILPPVPIRKGSGNYSWGESADDALPDLVNSVRIHVSQATTPGELKISLLSLDRAGAGGDVPAFPAGHNFIGVWSFASTTDFVGVDLAVRYDDALAANLGLDEEVLKLWRFDPDNQAWERVLDPTFRRYSALNIVSGHAGNNFTYFAVSAPEPAVLGPLGLGAYLLLLRRRRDRRS